MVTLTKAQRVRLFSMFNGKCAYCGAELPEKGWHADHVEPIYRQTRMVKVDGQYKYVKTGKCDLPENDRADNFMPSCRPCNIDKAASPLEVWRKSLERKVYVLRTNYSAWWHAERFGLVAQVKSKVIFYFETRVESVAVASNGECLK